MNIYCIIQREIYCISLQTFKQYVYIICYKHIKYIYTWTYYIIYHITYNIGNVIYNIYYTHRLYTHTHTHTHTHTDIYTKWLVGWCAIYFTGEEEKC